MDNLSKPVKILLVVGTLWPFVYVPLFMLAIFSLAGLTAVYGNNAEPPAAFFIVFFGVVMPLHLLTILLMQGLLIFFIIHIIYTERMPKNIKAVWAGAIMVFNVMVMPFYWYFSIWREPRGQVNSER